MKGLSKPLARGGEDDEEDPAPAAHFGSTGDDFPLVAWLP
jgi:hypothetical protein